MNSDPKISDAPATHQADAHAGGAATPAERVVAGLKALIVDAIPTAHDFSFVGVERAAGGLSRENWSLDATWVARCANEVRPGIQKGLCVTT